MFQRRRTTAKSTSSAIASSAFCAYASAIPAAITSSGVAGAWPETKPAGEQVERSEADAAKRDQPEVVTPAAVPDDIVGFRMEGDAPEVLGDEAIVGGIVGVGGPASDRSELRRVRGERQSRSGRAPRDERRAPPARTDASALASRFENQEKRGSRSASVRCATTERQSDGRGRCLGRTRGTLRGA